MYQSARQELLTLRDLIRYGVSRLNAAQVALGHGSDNAWDETVYLVLHALHLPLDTLEPFLDARVLSEERNRVLELIDRRVTERVPAAYLTNEAWLLSLIHISGTPKFCLTASKIFMPSSRPGPR